MTTSCENSLIWTPRHTVDDMLKLIPVIVWDRVATSHYLRQCWVRSLSPYVVIRSQWIKCILRNTIECRYNAVQYSKLLHKWLPELRPNINKMLDPQKTPHTSPVSTCELWGVFGKYFWENWPRYNGTALYAHSLHYVVFCSSLVPDLPALVRDALLETA